MSSESILKLDKEICDILKEKGIQTYCIILRDPDSYQVATSWIGDKGTIFLECSKLTSEILSDHLNQNKKEDDN